MRVITEFEPEDLSILNCKDTIIISTIEKKLEIVEDVLGNILVKNKEVINLSEEKKVEGLFIKKLIHPTLKLYIPKGISFSIERPRKSKHVHSLYYDYNEFENMCDSEHINTLIQKISIEIYFDYIQVINRHIIRPGDTLFELKFTDHNAKKVVIYDKDLYIDFSDMLC